MRKGKRKEEIAERKDPGDTEPKYCSPGSIEQQLDMCENGELRGDQILHNHGIEEEEEDESLPSSEQELDQILNHYFKVDMAEEGREGDELTGDEHSSGLQGEDSEFAGQIHLDTGLPGGRIDRIAKIEELEEEEREGENLTQPRSKPARTRHLRNLK